MISITLPYPNIDFVPLDVLKADDLDKIVANINAVVTAINSYTLPEPILASGTASLSVQSGSTSTASINIPSQANTNYKVFLTSSNPELLTNVSSKTTSTFNIVGTNNTENDITATCDYLVIKA